MSEQERNKPEILRAEKPENHKLRIGGEGGAEYSIGEEFVFNGTKVIFSKIDGELAHFLVFLEGEKDETVDLQIEVQLEIKDIADLQTKIEAAIKESQKPQEKTPELEGEYLEALEFLAEKIRDADLESTQVEDLLRQAREVLQDAQERGDLDFTDELIEVMEAIKKVAKQEAGVNTEDNARRERFQEGFRADIRRLRKQFSDGGVKVEPEDIAGLKAEGKAYIQSEEFLRMSDQENKEHLDDLINRVFDKSLLKDTKPEAEPEKQRDPGLFENRGEGVQYALDAILTSYNANPVTRGFDKEKRQEVIETITQKVLNELFTNPEFEKMRRAQVTDWVRRAVDKEVERNNTANTEQPNAEKFANVREVLEFAKSFAQAYLYDLINTRNIDPAVRWSVENQVRRAIEKTVNSEDFVSKSKQEITELARTIVDLELETNLKKAELYRWCDLQGFSEDEKKEAATIAKSLLETEDFTNNKDKDTVLDSLKATILARVEKMRSGTEADAEAQQGPVDEDLFEYEETPEMIKDRHREQIREWRWWSDFDGTEQDFIFREELDFFGYQGGYDSATDKEKAVREFRERVRSRIERQRAANETDRDLEDLRRRRQEDFDDDFEDGDEPAGKEPRTIEEIIEQTHERYKDKERRENVIGEAVSREIFQVRHQENVNEAVADAKESGMGHFADRREKDEDGEEQVIENTTLDILIDEIKKSKKTLEKEIKKELAEGGSPNAKIELMREQEIVIEDLEKAKTRKEEMAQAFDDNDDHDIWGKVLNSPIMLAHMVRRLGSAADARNTLLRAKLTNAIPATWPGIIRKPARVIVGSVVGAPKFFRLLTLGIIPMAAFLAGATILNWSLDKGMDLVAKFTKTDVRKWFKSKK